MSLLETIKNDTTLLRKAKSKFALSIVTTLYGEAAMVGKGNGNRESTDAEVVKVVNEFIKNIQKTIVNPKVKLSETQIYNMEHEVEILSKYLPPQLTADELTAIITQLTSIDKCYSLPKDMGKIMKYLSTEYAGRFNGKVASDIIKRM